MECIGVFYLNILRSLELPIFFLNNLFHLLFLNMADRKNIILVSLVFFFAVQYVSSTVIQLQIANIHTQNQAFMMIIILMVDVDAGPKRTLWRYGRVKGIVD